jgi:hypothetical protein
MIGPEQNWRNLPVSSLVGAFPTAAEGEADELDMATERALTVARGKAVTVQRHKRPRLRELSDAETVKNNSN